MKLVVALLVALAVPLTLLLSGCEITFAPPPSSQAVAAAVPYDYGAGKLPPQ